MRNQLQLLGAHPAAGPFANWLTSADPTPSATQCYRTLTPNQAADIDWIARRLIHYHYSEDRIRRLKAKYTEIGYPAYANAHRKLPTLDMTKKGNFGEVILSEYIEACKTATFIKVFKLRYNPNVDQAMKGDDVLMINLTQTPGEADKLEVYLGETKFRTTPTKTVVDELQNALQKDKLPLSYSYVVEELAKDTRNENLVDVLDKFIMREVHGHGGVFYFGLLMGGARAGEMLQTHMNTDNAKLILISISDANLGTLVDQGFDEATRLISDEIDTI